MSLPKMTTRPTTRRRPAPSSVVRAARPVLEALEGRQLYAATLTLANPFLLPASDRLIFNQIGNVNTFTPANVVHSQQNLTLGNTGTTPLTITSLTLSGPFAFVTAPTLPITIAPNATTSVGIKFTQAVVPSHSTNETNYTTATNAGAYVGGSLTIASNDATTPTKVVALAGYFQQLSNNNNEPSLQTIVNRVAGYDVNLGLSGSAVDFPEGTTPTLYGSEVYSTSWEAANAAAPVTVQQLAAFHTQGNTATLSWYAAATEQAHQLLRSTAAQGQTVLPTTSDTGTTPLTKSFTPGVAFGFKVDTEYSDDDINVAAGNTGGGGHHFRFFPLVDETGTAVPNTYVVAMDYGVTQAENFDFQDNVYVVSNIRPSATPDTPTNLTATSGASPTLSWTASAYSPVAYNVYRATTANGTYTKLTATPVSATTYTDAADNGALAYYRVTAVDATQSPAAESAPASATANAGPVAAAYTYAAVSGTPQTIDPLANDTDPTGTIEPATVLISTGPNEGGTATVDPTSGDITYTPASTFTGIETLAYTVADSNGARSQPATITFNVAATAAATSGGGDTGTGTGTTTGSGTNPTGTPDTGTVTTTPFIAQTLANTAVTIPVLSVDAAATTFDLTKLTITAQPGNGNAASDGAGNIVYTPGTNFVGGTELTYTITDANGTVSAATTVDVNVGVAIGTGTAYKTATFNSEGKTAATVLINKGTAAVYFDGIGTVIAKGKTATVAGTDMYIRDIGLSGTTAASSLQILGAHNGSVRLGGVFGSTPLGTLRAPYSPLLTNGGSAQETLGNAHPAGNIDLPGLRALRLASATNAVISLGTASVAATTVQFAGAVSGTSLTDTAPIRVLQAASWTDVPAVTPGPITAPSLGVLTVKGEFDSDLTLTAASTGRALTLGSARVGTAADGTWTVAGNAGNVLIGAAASTFGGVNAGTDETTGGINAFRVASGNLAADVSASTIGTFAVAGTYSGDLTTSGNVNAVTVGDLSDAAISVGTAATLDTVTAANVGTATLRVLHVTGRGTNAFNDSTVIAGTILTAVTGQVNASTTNPEGLAAHVFHSAVVGVNGNVALNSKDLASSDALATYISAKGKTLGTFQIKFV